MKNICFKLCFYIPYLYRKILADFAQSLIEGAPWFLGTDIGVCLGYANPRKAYFDHTEKVPQSLRSPGIEFKNSHYD